MRSAEKIKTFIETRIQSDPEVNAAVFNELCDEMDRAAGRHVGGDKTIWSLMMSSYKAKMITSAAAVLAVVLLVTVFSSHAKQAWAIDDTIRVLETIENVYLTGEVNYPGQETQTFRIWARPSAADRAVSGDFRLEEGDEHVAVAVEDENVTYVYTKDGEEAIVYVTEGLNRRCDAFPSSDLFKQFKAMATNWTESYGVNAINGRDTVTVRFEGPGVDMAKYWEFEFDLETKFPIRASVWWNKDYSGQPHFDYRDIQFNVEQEMDLYEFVVNDTMQVVDCRAIDKMIEQRGDCGIDVSGLDTGKACEKVVMEYWQAVIDKNTKSVEQIRVVGDPEDIEVKTFDGVVGMNHLNDPGTYAEVTCRVEDAGGEVVDTVLLIDIKADDGKTHGVVVGKK